jgi:hypothetical protein
VLNPDGTPKDASPMRRGDAVEELWEVTAHGHDPATRHPFAQALETARLWHQVSATHHESVALPTTDCRPTSSESGPHIGRDEWSPAAPPTPPRPKQFNLPLAAG